MRLLEEQEQASVRYMEAKAATEEAFWRQADARREWEKAGPEAKDEARKVWDDLWDAWLKTDNLVVETGRRYDLLF